MFCSWTQTYGNERKDLLKYQMWDDQLVRFKNLFDVNLYSFHNCNDNVIEYFKSINRLENTQIIRFNNCLYTDCVRSILTLLDELHCRFLFFIQDDGLSIDKVDYKLLLESVQEGDYVSLGYCRNEMKMEPKDIKGIFYEYTSQDFFKSEFWPLDDSPYLADYNIVKNIYNKNYLDLNTNDVWRCETQIARRFHNEVLIKKVLKQKAFANINTIGPHSQGILHNGLINGDTAKDFIKNKFQKYE